MRYVNGIISPIKYLLIILFIQSSLAQSIQFFPETDTLFVYGGCTGAVVYCSVSEGIYSDSVIIEEGFNTSLWYFTDQGGWEDYLSKCYFIIPDSSDEFDYELWYVPNNLLPYQERISMDTTYMFMSEFFDLLLIARKDGEQVDSLSQVCKARWGLGVNGQLQYPRSIKLIGNYPNPFNPSTVIEYQLSQPMTVELRVFNLLGEEIITLVSEYQAAGNKSVNWDAAGLPGGVYFYQLRTSGYAAARKMVLLK